MVVGEFRPLFGRQAPLGMEVVGPLPGSSSAASIFALVRCSADHIGVLVTPECRTAKNAKHRNRASVARAAVMLGISWLGNALGSPEVQDRRARLPE